MSAAAVDAVRAGLRTAFARASRPAAPPAREAGQPSTSAIGRAMLGAAMAIARNTASTPIATRSSRGPVAMPEAKAPTQIERDGDRAHAERDRGAEAGEPRLREHRPLPHGGDRRDAGGAHRRQQAGEGGDDGADDQRDDDRPGGEDEPRQRQVGAEGVEEGLAGPSPARDRPRGRRPMRRDR